MFIVDWLNGFLWSKVLIVVLILSGVYFMIRLRFLNLTQFKEMFRIVLERGDGKGISPFQAFCISAASKVGTGSIAGVALAISVGGPGSVFWMWILTLVVGSLSLVENTLAQIYKTKDQDIFIGGPAYYIEKGMNNKALGIIFSILITVTFGFIFNAVQANTISVSLHHAYDIPAWQTGLFLTVLTALIIFGGAKRIAKASEVITPIMGAFYLGIGLFVIIKNASVLPEVLSLIVTNAFNPEAAGGGALGVIIMEGIKRGLFSNEAGMGSTPNAAAVATTTHPFKQGLIQTLGVYITTLGVCSATAFIILCSGVLGTTDHKGVELTQIAMTKELGTWGQTFLLICIFLFAYTSVIGNYFYGMVNVENAKKTWIKKAFQLIALIMVFWGCIQDAPYVWALADLFMALMTLVNLYALFRLRKPAIECIQDYIKQRKQKKNPVFKKSTLTNPNGVDCWD